MRSPLQRELVEQWQSRQTRRGQSTEECVEEPYWSILPWETRNTVTALDGYTVRSYAHLDMHVASRHTAPPAIAKDQGCCILPSICRYPRLGTSSADKSCASVAARGTGESRWLVFCKRYVGRLPVSHFAFHFTVPLSN